MLCRNMWPYIERQDMQRRSFLMATGQVFVLALAAPARRGVVAQERPQSERYPGDLEDRVASVLQAFDAQGNHKYLQNGWPPKCSASG
jgi:hypothetical protein